jgi:hypothetical protein
MDGHDLTHRSSTIVKWGSDVRSGAVVPLVMAKSSSRPRLGWVMASKRRRGLGYAYLRCFGVRRSFSMASGSNGSSSQLRRVARWLQGSFGDEKATNGSGSSSSTLPMPSVANKSSRTQARLHARVAVLRVEITTEYATIYRGKYAES